MELKMSAIGVPDLRLAFLDEMSKLQGKFCAAEQDIGQRNEALKQAIDDFRCIIKAGIDTKELAKDNTLSKVLSDLDDALKSKAKKWIEHVAAYETGAKFRKGFNDSLLVYVLGKVKAGKSSLGNYIAYGLSDPSKDPNIIPSIRASGAPMPEFKMEVVCNGAEIEKDIYSFAVGATETTSSIQRFKLAGLTWVDSPGLHSVTGENNELALRYVECADLIIYPLNAAHPGRLSDTEELRKIDANGKAVITIITKSDNVAEKVENEKIVSDMVMMDLNDQNDQKHWVQGEIRRKVGKTVDVICLSVAYAEKYRGEPGSLEKSGVADLMDRLIETARSEAVELKRKTPSDNLKAFVDKILEPGRDDALYLGGVKKLLATAKGEISGLRQSVQSKLATAAGHAKGDVALAIRAEAERNVRNPKALADNCTNLVKSKTEEYLKRAVSEIFSQAEKIITDLSGANVTEIQAYDKLTETITTSSAGKGRAIGTAGGAAVGAAVGSLVPVVGTAIGSGVGAVLGGLLGGLFSEEHSYEVSRGDNAASVIVSAIEQTSKVLDRNFDQAFPRFQESLKPIEDRIAAIADGIDSFENTLRTKVMPQ